MTSHASSAPLLSRTAAPPAYAAALPGTRLFSARVPALRRLDEGGTRVAVAGAFSELLAAARAAGTPHPVRVWSFIPGIHDRLSAEDRYMAFNAGRHDAMLAFFGSPAALASAVPSASGVGVPTDDFTLHLLAAAAPGIQVNNPAQTPAYRYSPRYGRLPPCFARATRSGSPATGGNSPATGGGSRLLVAGTAAITGEDSRHPGALDAQWHLTLANLRTLLAADAPAAPGEDLLRRFSSVRIYVPRPDDAPSVDSLAAAAFACPVELVQADLCRSELLVEIEGLAASPAARDK